MEAIHTGSKVSRKRAQRRRKEKERDRENNPKWKVESFHGYFLSLSLMRTNTHITRAKIFFILSYSIRIIVYFYESAYFIPNDIIVVYGFDP